jgi:apolipoprotein D and lipocalin family protein
VRGRRHRDLHASCEWQDCGGESVRKQDGSIQTATGKAEAVNEGKSVLKVSFFWPFYGDYQIMELDPEYRWALIGEPRRKYLWVLAREPKIDEAVLNRLLERARAQGYDTAPVILTPQRVGAS